MSLIALSAGGVKFGFGWVKLVSKFVAAEVTRRTVSIYPRFCLLTLAATKHGQTPHWTFNGFYSNFRLVANAAKTTGQNPPAKTGTVSFEEALKKLESIVESMESGDLPLETLLAKYEEGTKLARICQTKLAEAELKIEQLEKTGAGELQLKPLETDEAER
jgi:exodeoxyribonuclease VII small subunit